MNVELYTNALAPFLKEARRLLPAGAYLIDAHTHLGRDEDGRSLDLQTLISQLDEASIAKACVFALHDPERKPAYTTPNDRVLGWAQQSEGRLIPFCRLDPAEDPVGEGRRCLERGARGIKLHPRAQAFTFNAPALEAVFALAGEANVPILIHAGRGMPPIADELASLALRYPDVVLILAHGAICDQGVLTARLAEHPNVLYDVSCFFPVDVIQLFARVPAERIVFASDPPYGRPASALYLTLRVAAYAGLDERALRGVLGETVAQLDSGRGLAPVAAPRGAEQIMLSGRLARVYGYASLTGPALFGGILEQGQAMLEMALAACRDPQPDAVGEALEVIGHALGAALELMRNPDGVPAALNLVYCSMVRAATEIPFSLDGSPSAR